MKLKKSLKVSFILISIVVSTFSDSKAQELPDYEGMLLQGVAYDNIKSQTEAVINATTTLDDSEGSDINHYKRWLDYWEPRAYVNGENVATPIVYKQAMFDYYTLNGCGNSTTPEWEFLGPYRINKAGTLVPVLVMGRVNAVAMSPSNLNVI